MHTHLYKYIIRGIRYYLLSAVCEPDVRVPLFPVPCDCIKPLTLAGKNWGDGSATVMPALTRGPGYCYGPVLLRYIPV